MVAIELSLFAIVVFAAVVCFLLTWSIGANDVANTFGTSVGAKVLTVKQACLIAAIFEFLGAFLMGSHVAETFREKLLFTSFWENEPSVLAVGMTASMIGAFFLITLATFFSLPVSGTHAILGAVIGFAIVSRGYDSVQWGETFFIISGWMLSPLLAGATAFVMFWLLRRFILRSEESFKKGIQFLPICYGTTVSLVALFILFKGSAGLDLSIFPTWMILTAVLMAGLVTGVAIWCFTPCIINWAEKNANSPSVPDAEVNLEELEDADPLPPPSTVAKEVIESSSEIEIELTKEEQTSREVPQPKEGKECSAEIVIESGADIDIGKETKKTKSIETEKKEVNKPKSDSETKQADEIVSAKTEVNEQDAPPASEEFDDKTEQLFSMGQVLMAIVGSFAHGANDIANAIGPFAVVIGVYNSGSVHSTGAIPWWILVMGGVGIVTGLAMWGYKVIKTIGERLTKVTPSRGFNIELGSAITVMGASRIGIPLSTTHCKVGAVIGVGLCDGGAAVQWKMVGNVAVGWFVTLPIAGAVSAAFFLFLSHLSDYS